jgi:hypothetical protein
LGRLRHNTGEILSAPAAAQQADPAFLQRAVTALRTQRNLAMDAQVVAEARAAGLAEDLAKAQVRIKELEPKPKGE